MEGRKEKDSSPVFYYAIWMYVQGIIMTTSLILSIEMPCAALFFIYPFLKIYWFYDGRSMDM